MANVFAKSPKLRDAQGTSAGKLLGLLNLKAAFESAYAGSLKYFSKKPLLAVCFSSTTVFRGHRHVAKRL